MNIRQFQASGLRAAAAHLGVPPKTLCFAGANIGIQLGARAQLQLPCVMTMPCTTDDKCSGWKRKLHGCINRIMCRHCLGAGATGGKGLWMKGLGQGVNHRCNELFDSGPRPGRGVGGKIQ